MKKERAQVMRGTSTGVLMDAVKLPPVCPTLHIIYKIYKANLLNLSYGEIFS